MGAGIFASVIGSVERLTITLSKWFADLILDIFTLDLSEGLFVVTPCSLSL